LGERLVGQLPRRRVHDRRGHALVVEQRGVGGEALLAHQLLAVEAPVGGAVLRVPLGWDVADSPVVGHGAPPPSEWVARASVARISCRVGLSRTAAMCASGRMTQTSSGWAPSAPAVSIAAPVPVSVRASSNPRPGAGAASAAARGARPAARGAPR